MKRNTKHKIEIFSFYDHTGIEKHLEKMAKNGWLLKKINQFSWVYQRIEPQNLHFSVTYYPAASDYDPEPSEDQQIYHDYSAHNGWTYLCSSAQMQIFCNYAANPVPTETDPLVEVQEIHRAVKRVFLPSAYLMAALSVLQAVLFVLRLLGDPIGLLSSPSQLAIGSCWAILFLHYAVELSRYYLWHHKALQAAQYGEFLATPSTMFFQKCCIAIVIGEFIYVILNLISTGNQLMVGIYFFSLIAIILTIAATDAVRAFLKYKKASRKMNFRITAAVTFVLYFLLTGGVFNGALSGMLRPDSNTHNEKYGILYQDSIPLAVEDLREVAYTGYVREHRSSESMFLGQIIVRQWHGFDSPASADIPELRYTVTIVKMPSLYQICKDEILSRYKDGFLDHGTVRVNHYEAVDAAPWLAEEAYQLHWGESILNKYLLCYPDRIIEIDFDWEPTAEQMITAAEKLAF